MSAILEKIYRSHATEFKKRLEMDLYNVQTKGIIDVGGKKCVTGYSYGELFDWDMYFENLALSYFGICDHCKDGVTAFLDRQHENGYISRTLGVVWPKIGQHFKPFLAQTALLYVKQTGDLVWLKEDYYDRLIKYLDYWVSEEYDSNKNGLPVWNSADHTGMDNQDERAGAIDSYVCEGVDLAVFLGREFEAMSELAQMIGRHMEQKAYKDCFEEMKSKIRLNFWDKEDGFFYDINVRTGKFIRCKTVAGFSPLWIGAASTEQTERLIKEHLLNPEEFWLEYPVAAMSKQEPGYRQDKYDYETCCNWKGTVWIPSNYYIFNGLIRYGYIEIAREIAQKTLTLMLQSENTREYYNGENGKGLGLDPFWGWSILGYFMRLEVEENYHPAEVDQKIIAYIDLD